MITPSMCRGNSVPVFPEDCERAAFWEVPVESLAEIKDPSRNHAYILPDNSIWVLDYTANRFIRIFSEGGESGEGKPTAIKNEDGLVTVRGSGTYSVTVDLNTEQLMAWFKTNAAAEFQQWFDSIKEILASIDPGGVLLDEIIEARTSTRFGPFARLHLRLENIERYLDGTPPPPPPPPPVGFAVRIRHNLNRNPKVEVKAYDYALGAEPNGLGTGPAGSFGGTNFRTAPTRLEYTPGVVTVYMPIEYKLSGNVQRINSQLLLLVEPPHTLEFNIEGGAISGEVVDEVKPNVTTPKNLQVTGNSNTSVNLKWERGE